MSRAAAFAPAALLVPTLGVVIQSHARRAYRLRRWPEIWRGSPHGPARLLPRGSAHIAHPTKGAGQHRGISGSLRPSADCEAIARRWKSHPGQRHARRASPASAPRRRLPAVGGRSSCSRRRGVALGAHDFHRSGRQPGPYLELFARARRAGWDSWGGELDIGERLDA